MAEASFTCADSYDVPTNTPLNGGEVVSFRVAAGGTYYIFVDGFKAGNEGNFELVLDLSSGTSCSDAIPIPVWPGPVMKFLGSTSGGAATQQGSCGGQPGNDVVYQLIPQEDGMIALDLDAASTNYNSALYARSTCAMASTEIACANVPASLAPMAVGTGEHLDLTTQNQTPVFVFVDGSQNGGGNPNGNFGLKLTP